VYKKNAKNEKKILNFGQNAYFLCTLVQKMHHFLAKMTKK